MNRKEFDEWLEKSERVECVVDEWDERGNHRVEIIRKKDDKYYRVGFLNDHPNPYWGKNGWEEDHFELREVFPIPRWIETTEWIDVKTSCTESDPCTECSKCPSCPDCLD